MSKRKVYFKYLGNVDKVKNLVQFLLDFQDENLNKVNRPNEVPKCCVRDGEYIICRNKEYLEFLCLNNKWYYRDKYSDITIMMSYCLLYPPSFSEKDMNFIYKYSKYVTKRALNIANAYNMNLYLRSIRREVRLSINKIY